MRRRTLESSIGLPRSLKPNILINNNKKQVHFVLTRGHENCISLFSNQIFLELTNRTHIFKFKKKDKKICASFEKNKLMQIIFRLNYVARSIEKARDSVSPVDPARFPGDPPPSVFSVSS